MAKPSTFKKGSFKTKSFSKKQNKKDIRPNAVDDVKANNYPSRCCIGACSNCANCKICRTGLDDQVKIIYGIFILVMVILGYQVNSDFFFIIGIASVLYILSGLTGICFIKKAFKNYTL